MIFFGGWLVVVLEGLVCLFVLLGVLFCFTVFICGKIKEPDSKKVLHAI